MNPFQDNNDEASSSNLFNWFDENNSVLFTETSFEDISLTTTNFFRPFRQITSNNEHPHRSRELHIISSPRIPRFRPRYQPLDRLFSIWDNRFFERKYGCIFLDSLQKMVSKKLLYVNEPCNLYKKFFFIFYTQFKRGNKDTLSQFIKCFPDIQAITELIHSSSFNKKNNVKNVLFIKICLDILDAYFDKVDSLILNQKYVNDYLQLFILFYSSISTRNLQAVVNKLKDINTNFYVQYKRLIEFEKDEFIQYYNKEEKEKNNLYGGMEIKSDLFVQ